MPQPLKTTSYAGYTITHYTVFVLMTLNQNCVLKKYNNCTCMAIALGDISNSNEKDHARSWCIHE